jgi:DNA-binding beta-propeller fold protein YncE
MRDATHPRLLGAMALLAALTAVATDATAQCNGTCENPIDIVLTPVGIPGNRVATYQILSLDSDRCGVDNYDTPGSDGHDVVMRFEAPFTGRATIDTCGFATYDTKLTAVEGGSCCGCEVAYNDDFCGLQSRIRFAVVAGKRYNVILDGYGGGTGLADVSFHLDEGSGPGRLWFLEDSNSNGLHELDPLSGAVMSSRPSGVLGATCGLAPSNYEARLYGSVPFGLTHISTFGGGVTTHGSEGIEGLAFDYHSSNLFAAINGNFLRIHPVTGANIQSLPAPGDDVEGLAYDSGRQIYGIGSNNDVLMAYDIPTMSWRTIGSLGFGVDDCGLAYDPVSRRLFLKSQGDTFLYRVDPDTAQPTLIGDTGITRGGGLAFAFATPGGLFFSEDNRFDGLHQLDRLTAHAFHVGESGVTSSTVGLAPTPSSNMLYGSSPWGLVHTLSDGTGSAFVGGETMEGMAFDPFAGEIYGSLNNNFFTVDRGTGSRIATLPPMGFDTEALAYDGHDAVYAVDATNGWLMVYAISTASWHQVIPLGISAHGCGLAFEPFTRSLYLKCMNDPTLYVIDTRFAAKVRAIGDTGINAGGGLAFAFGDFEQCTLCGDCDGNDTGPDILDALTAAQIGVGLVSPSMTQTMCCDTNSSGSVDVIDALQMAQVGAGFPVLVDCP